MTPRIIAAVLACGAMGCAARQAPGYLTKTVSMKLGWHGTTWQASVPAADGAEPVRVALRPLCSVEGGIVSVEIQMTRPDHPDENLLGERAYFDEERREYPDQPFVIEVGRLTGDLPDGFGRVREFDVPSVARRLRVEILEVGIGYGAGGCQSCPLIQHLVARISVFPRGRPTGR
jgi:hypothetical protein